MLIKDLRPLVSRTLLNPLYVAQILENILTSNGCSAFMRQWEDEDE